MNIILFDLPEDHQRLLPLTYTRPVSGLLTGLFTHAEKWQLLSGHTVSYLTRAYLQKKFPLKTARENLLINGALSPEEAIYARISKLKMNDGLFLEGKPLALKLPEKRIDDFADELDAGRNFPGINKISYPGRTGYLSDLTYIFMYNGHHITEDFKLLNGEKSNPPEDKHTILYNTGHIYIGKNCSIRASVLDATKGPIYIGSSVTVQPGSVISGPAAILDNSVISAGAKIRPSTTIGPDCRIGGEVSHVVFQGSSNKSHDGFIGSSVIGKWCNLGAGTNNSNLKNNYTNVKLWDYATGKLRDTGLIYCGLMMGDHSKCGISTMFNTGTVVGVNANIFGPGYMPKFIPSFSWGGSDGFITYDFDKALKTANIVMERRSQRLTELDREMLGYIYKQSLKFRGGIKSV